MSNYKEIVTKAVIGKGKKYFKNKYSVKSEVVPSTILGCWIINHKFKGYVQGDDVVVDGSFDINIWYSYDNDTKTNVINETIKIPIIAKIIFLYLPTKESFSCLIINGIATIINPVNSELIL